MEVINDLSLSDIVDRGASSYKTFTMVNNLIKSGKGYGVISNHDNKLYRWFKKWQGDSDEMKYAIEYGDGSSTLYPTYGMKVAHGLGKTLDEFMLMNRQEKDKYAYDFIKYYDNLNPYLRLDRDGTKHFFSHAGMSVDIIRGMPVTKRDISVLLYTTLTGDDGTFRNLKDKVVIHLGHDSHVDAP